MTADPRMRFPRIARVRARAEYASVFEHGRRTSDPLLSLHWMAGDPPPRLGLAVSRKVDKRAVTRNRIKRILRETTRGLRSQLAGGDYVVVVRVGAAKATAQQLRAAYIRVLQRAGALPLSAAGGTMPPAAVTHPSPSKPA